MGGEVIQELGKKDPDVGAYVKDPTVCARGSRDLSPGPAACSGSGRALEEAGRHRGLSSICGACGCREAIDSIIYRIGCEKSGIIVIDNASVSLIELEEEQQPRVFVNRVESASGVVTCTDARDTESGESGRKRWGSRRHKRKSPERLV